MRRWPVLGWKTCPPGLPSGETVRRWAGPEIKPEKALLCTARGVTTSANGCGGKPILPEPRSVKKAIFYQMNPKPSMGLPSHLTLCSTLLVAAARWNSLAPAATLAPQPGESALPTAIPWTQVGAAAGTQYSGDGLTVTRTREGARLRCAFQRLAGEATREGLSLNSTVPDQPNDSFRVKATAVERVGNYGLRQSAVAPPLSDLTEHHEVASQSGGRSSCRRSPRRFQPWAKSPWTTKPCGSSDRGWWRTTP